jgi:outer membrane protein assembly factor BamA
MRVASNVERQIDDAARKVNLLMRVESGPQFVFGKLAIQGLDIHGEAAIKKLWALEPGKPFNVEYPQFFLNRVREDGIFDNLGPTRPDLKVNDAGLTVDVTLVFLRDAPPKPARPE